jgi:hypothetical protein
VIVVGVRSLIARNRTLFAVVAALVIAGVVFVLVWFQPQKLFLDQRVAEGLPGAAAQPLDQSPGIPSPSGAAAPDPVEGDLTTLAHGRFQSLEHETGGRALILEEADGSRYLRFEDLETSNGPDLHVYLSEIAASDDWYAYGERFVDLGKLKGNIGDQNYEIPRRVDLSRYRSAVIWCKRFSVGFGVAPLGL